jgi:predicted nucleotidyltransferase
MRRSSSASASCGRSARTKTIFRALGVTRLWLFGSLARGDARPDSDVDVLSDIIPGRKFSLLDLAEVRIALCDLLGAKPASSSARSSAALPRHHRRRSRPGVLIPRAPVVDRLRRPTVISC